MHDKGEKGALWTVLRGYRLRSGKTGAGAIAAAAQDTAFFNDSIGNNIAYARPVSTQRGVEAAARGAQLHGLVASLPQRYDSQVGERGVMLSGGERQRIGIARAILKNSAVLVFEEGTSALDADAEHAIVRELDRLARGRTTLVVAHRLSTIAHADAIVVMDAGRIVERGTHADLLGADGLYAHLWRLRRRAWDAKKTPGEPGV
jgi:ABC-type transport system involved in Fe-S cluster assembly fused permease/ATPase subunit